MKLKIHKPSKALEGIVKQYVEIQSIEDQEKLWVLPNLGNYLLFNPGIDGVILGANSDEVIHTVPKKFSVGIKSTEVIRIIVTEKNNVSFPMYGIELHPTGYHRLFAKNAYKLQEEHLLFEDFIQNKDIFNELYTIDSVPKQLLYFEKCLLQLKEDAKKTEELVNKMDEIIAYIVENLASVKVNDLLSTFSYSRTSLERAFKKVVGYTPKEFIQTMRFYMVAKDLIGHGYDYKSLGYDFFDQSHMNKAFKKFVNVLPSKFKAYIKENDIQIYSRNN